MSGGADFLGAVAAGGADPFLLCLSTAPYPGLRPFRRDEADIFFGRDRQTDQLLRKLQEHRFLAVVGPSGCGKSSLVRAGMVAALETGFMAVAGAHWRVAEMRPGNRPMGRLAEALVDPRVLGGARGGSPSAAAFLEATLRRGPLGLLEALRETPLPAGTNLLLLVDQFEEIFRFRGHEGIGAAADEADAFVALLLATAAQQEVPVYVVLTMRSDFIGDCAVFDGLPEAMNRSQYLTPRLTREQSAEAVSAPARVFGGEVDAALVNRLLNDLGPHPDQLPVLQHALMRMWDRASGGRQGGGEAPPAGLVAHGGPAAPARVALDDYLAIGGLSHALSDHADEAYGELSERQQAIAETLFRLLTERTRDRRDVRRPVRLEVVAEVAAAGLQEEVGAGIRDEVRAVVEVFRREDRSFVTPPAGTELTPDTVLDIGHESLIRQWKRLGEWVAREADAADVYRRLLDAAGEWRQGNADLLEMRALDRALAWRAAERRTREWARRYGSDDDFALAMRFLEESERARLERIEQERTERERQERAEREAREKELRLAKTFGLIIAVLLVITVLALVAAAVAAFKNYQKKQELQVAGDSLTALLQTTDSLKRAAESAVRTYGAVLSDDASYHDTAGARARRAEFYRTLLPAWGSLDSEDRFDRLKALLQSTHANRLPFAPSTYLFPWTDLRPERRLQSIYGSQPPGARFYVRPELAVADNWFREQPPMRGDLHNQFAIDRDCDNFRGERVYAELRGQPGAGPTQTLENCGTRSAAGFEPFAGKGPVARATLYFLIRYPWTDGVARLDRRQIAMLLRWSREDTVTVYERHRNEAIQSLQGNRNPLVDYPGWAHADSIDFGRGLRDRPEDRRRR